MFPWAGLLVAGTVVGELLDRARTEADERRVLAGLATGGSLLFTVALGCSWLPSPFPNTYFWTTGPSYFFARVGLMTALLPLVWLWTRRAPAGRFSPMLQLGKTSLFIYWIHVEMVYGLLSWPLHRALPIAGAFAAFVAFTGFLLLASLAKDRLVARAQGMRPASVLASRTTGSP
jgi:uncharacterized membrane protein